MRDCDCEDCELIEMHVHADDCEFENEGNCTCVPYVVMGEDERTEEDIVEASHLWHKAN